MTQMLPVFNRDFKNHDEAQIISQTPKTKYTQETQRPVSLKASNSQNQLSETLIKQNQLIKKSDEPDEGSTGGSTLKQHIQISTEYNKPSDSGVKVSPPGVSQHSPTNLGFA